MYSRRHDLGDTLKRDELLQVRITKAELLDLRTAAIETKTSVSEIVRAALERALAPTESEDP